jgi:hypothetical protein
MRCPRCEETIGVYEPLRVLCPDETVRRGSVLTLAEDLRAAGAVVLHESCCTGDQDPRLP